jgi:hypothetical protein
MDKTYSNGDSPVVTHLTTNSPFTGLLITVVAGCRRWLSSLAVVAGCRLLFVVSPSHSSACACIGRARAARRPFNNACPTYGQTQVGVSYSPSGSQQPYGPLPGLSTQDGESGIFAESQAA